MKIAVLGASGLVGREIVRHLLDNGVGTVVAGVPANNRRVDALSAEVRVFNAEEPGAVSGLVADATHVVNCVMGTPAAMLGSTRGVLDILPHSTIAKYVHFSSVAVYGMATGRVDETQPFARKIDWYGAAKIGCERAIQGARAAGGRIVVLRPGLIHGPGSLLWSERIARLLYRHRLGDLGKRGEGTCNLVHVRDVARAAIAALTQPGIDGDAFNLADPAPPTWNEYFAFFARELGAVPVSSISGWELSIERQVFAPVLRLLEMGCRKTKFPLTVPDAITPGLARLFSLDVHYDSGRADALFEGWRTPWQLGVEEAARSMSRAEN